MLRRCEYDPDTQSEIIEGLVESTLRGFREELAKSKEFSEAARDQGAMARLIAAVRSWGGGRVASKRSFWSDVSWQAALLKHHSFRAEDEWRLIPERGDQTITRAVQRMVTAKKGEEFSIHMDPVVPEFREGRSSLMPYVPISLRGAHGEKAPVVKIVIGPTRYPDLALSALQRYIQKLGYEAVELTRTQATYRDM